MLHLAECKEKVLHTHGYWNQGWRRVVTVFNYSMLAFKDSLIDTPWELHFQSIQLFKFPKDDNHQNFFFEPD